MWKDITLDYQSWILTPTALPSSTALKAIWTFIYKKLRNSELGREVEAENLVLEQGQGRRIEKSVEVAVGVVQLLETSWLYTQTDRYRAVNCVITQSLPSETQSTILEGGKVCHQIHKTKTITEAQLLNWVLLQINAVLQKIHWHKEWLLKTILVLDQDTLQLNKSRRNWTTAPASWLS